MKNFKKILSVLMVILLVTTAVPLSSFVGIELPAFDLGIRASAISSSGKCGDNVTYTYDSTTKELVISGTGAMYDHDSSGSPFRYSDIKSVVIGNGITTIGDNAFYSCEYLTSVTIPNSVTAIGDLAFAYCENLAYITLPDSVASIGWAAFLKTGYYNCNPNWENNVLYIGNYLIDAREYLSGSYTIKDGTKVIANNAFSDCTILTSITIPDSVTTIGDYAFSGCTNLASAAIGAGVTLMGSSVFNGCPNLTELTIRTKEIPAYAFQNLTALKTVNLSEGVEKIGNYTFSGCTNLTSITILDGVKTIGDYAFSGCTNLTSITILDGVKTIGDYAFSGCTYLETINIPDSVTFVGIEILKNTAWFNYRGKGLIVLDGWAYGYKGSDENVTITFDETVKNVADEAFKNRSNIVAFEVDAGNPYLLSENGVLFTKDKTELIAAVANNIGSEYVIPDTVEKIHSDAFYNCNSLRKITIPASVKSIGTDAFSMSYVYNRSVYITDLEAWCKIDFANRSANPMCIGDYSSLHINGVAQSNITIPATITEIKPYAFYYCYSIRTVTIPDSVTTIGEYAFYNCDGLTSVTMGDSVTTIGYEAFRDCDGLTSVTFGDSVTTIGNYTFCSCNNLISITLSKDLQTIGNYAFGDCSKLRDVFYPGSQEDWDKVSGRGQLSSADLFLLHRHNYTVTVTNQPTCTQAGEALYICVHGDTKTEVIQPLGHTWDEGKITANSTCSKGGTKTYTCTVCFATKSETIETLDHNYQLISSYNPTCTKDGYDVYRCTYCGTTENRTTSPMLGHNFESEFTVDIDSTCTVTGIKSKHCTRCTETAEETVIPLKDHAWQTEPTVTKIPTCTAEGESVVLCRDCKIVKDGSSAVIPALGHDAKNQPFTVDVPATCVSFGKQSKHCTRCNYVEQITQIPMSEHDYYVAEESTATCSKPGVAIYVCRMCKDSFTVENSPALGHDFEYIIIVSPTCKAEGYEMGDCSRCDATDTRPVATIDHDYVRTEVAPTCLEDGVATYTCSYGCGTSYDETLPALGHSYPAVWVELLPATCSERGLWVKSCSACSSIISQVMPKLAHTDNNGNGVCDICNAGGTYIPNVPDTPDVPDETCDCNCHKGGLMGMLFKLILIFQKFFRMNKTCDCGVNHY